MKQIFILSLFCFFTLSANSQQMELNWITQIGGPNWDIVTDITETTDGQIIIVGSFYENISFGSDTLFSNGDRDIFIASYNSDGSFNKVISLGGIGYDYIKKVAVTSQSSIILPIQFARELALEGKEFKGKYKNNVQLSYFDKNLAYLNNLTISSNNNFDIISLNSTPDNGFLFTGCFNDTIIIDNKLYTSKGGSDIFMGKMSGDGKLKWIKHLEGEGNDKQSSLWSKDNNMNYIAGTTTDGCFGRDKKPKAEKNNNHLFLSQIDKNGNIGEVFYPANGISIAPVNILKDSTFLWILANFEHSVFVGENEFVSYGKNDVLLIKYNLIDRTSSSCQLGGFGNEKATGIVKSGNQIVITGQYAGSIAFAGKTIISDKRGSDIFIASVNFDCKPENIISFSGEGIDFPCSVISSGSAIYIAGEFNNTLVAGKTKLVSAGKEDIFLARIEHCGAQNPLKIIAKVDKSGASPLWELDAGEGFNSYAWDDSTSMNRYYLVETPGTFKVEVIDSLGCYHSSEINLNGTKSASIDDNESVFHEQEFKIYPTITSKFVHWEPADQWLGNNANVRIYNTSGKEFFSINIRELTKKVYQIDLASYIEGMYFVDISGENFREVSKVIIKK